MNKYTAILPDNKRKSFTFTSKLGEDYIQAFNLMMAYIEHNVPNDNWMLEYVETKDKDGFKNIIYKVI